MDTTSETGDDAGMNKREGRESDKETENGFYDNRLPRRPRTGVEGPERFSREFPVLPINSENIDETVRAGRHCVFALFCN